MPDAADRLATRFVFVAFSFVEEASETETDGSASSSLINIVPTGVPRVAFEGLVNVTENVSLYSSVLSASIPTETI